MNCNNFYFILNDTPKYKLSIVKMFMFNLNNYKQLCKIFYKL